MAAVALAAASYHGWHVVRARRSGRPGTDVDLTHAAMGVGTAAMLTLDLNAVTIGCLVAGFALVTLWYVVRAVNEFVDAGARSASVATRQLLCCIAMTGMLGISLGLGDHTMSGTTVPLFAAARASTVGHTGGMAHAMAATATLDPRLVVLGLLAIQILVVGWAVRGLIPRPSTHVGAQLAIGVSGATMLALML